ncbi:MAG: sulfite exporter TauE/SafE family protein [Propionibacteriaceae bacterium]|jgi:uncharacterized membrane protein YfcA|nr:sulfite exporter TauE/SafE family protein [Propionibacteriaceae bacterium]
MTEPTAPGRTWKHWLIFIGIGVAAGYLSGLFGVGGGTIIVPMLLTFAHFDVRKASGTSLAAIVPTAIVAVISYVSRDAVDWLAALLIVIGSVGGAQIGSHLLDKLPKKVIRWAFIGFLIAVIVSLFIVVTSRDSQIQIDFWLGTAMVALGLIVGVLSGLLGIGGGLVVVPMLILLFGASDLVAKGTSLAMMIPTAISGTIGNFKRGNVDLAAGMFIGAGACVTSALGAATAAWVDPRIGNMLFAAFLVVITVRMAKDALKMPKP